MNSRAIDTSRHRIFPVKVSAFLRNRAVELGGFAIVLAVLWLAAALATYDPADPSLNTASTRAPENIAGAAGATVADPVVAMDRHRCRACFRGTIDLVVADHDPPSFPGIRNPSCFPSLGRDLDAGCCGGVTRTVQLGAAGRFGGAYGNLALAKLTQLLGSEPIHRLSVALAFGTASAILLIPATGTDASRGNGAPRLCPSSNRNPGEYPESCQLGTKPVHRSLVATQNHVAGKRQFRCRAQSPSRASPAVARWSRFAKPRLSPAAPNPSW